MTSSRNYHHGFYQLPCFYGDCNISAENETVNFSEYKSICRPEREWLDLHDPQIRF